jgi:hypothetical protein
MPTRPLQDLPPFSGHAPPDELRPLGGYAVAMSVYAALTTAFGAWFKASGRELPERVEPYDLALIAAATHKSARLITKDKITEAVRAPFTEYQGPAEAAAQLDEKPRGDGARRTIGELLTCPYCISVWLATSFTAGMLVAPRMTRQVASVFTAAFGSDVLQQGYTRLSK